MSRPTIRVEGLGKQYRIGQRLPYKSLRESIMRALARGARLRPGRARETIWALRDVSFEIGEGEVVGVIGRNGAGKSTLLKILSRITEPTEGRVELHGRVGSLLEVGTGFHQELTGRENIYLNGAILGMRKAEIERKFDEIVSFAEVEKFIDTPVKHYSSGMYLRLAFAVAAHLDPEILLVDEVLAVGDAAFQKKCLGKIGDVSRTGRTVLFVSHNMSALANLCRRILWLGGTLVRAGDAQAIIRDYLASLAPSSGVRVWPPVDDDARRGPLALNRAAVEAPDGRPTEDFDNRQPIRISVRYSLAERLSQFRLCVRLLASDGVTVFQSCDSTNVAWDDRPREPGAYESSCIIPGRLLNEGLYTVNISADVPFVKVLAVEDAALSFRVVQLSSLGDRFAERWPGVICPPLEWEVVRLDAPKTRGAEGHAEVR
ncbi:MAG: ABC transporter ATP-binding protein [Acidobacteriota bacterium]